MRIDRAFGRKHSGALKVRDFDFDIKAVSEDGKFNGYGSVFGVVDSDFSRGFTDVVDDFVPKDTS